MRFPQHKRQNGDNKAEAVAMQAKAPFLLEGSAHLGITGSKPLRANHIKSAMDTEMLGAVATKLLNPLFWLWRTFRMINQSAHPTGA